MNTFKLAATVALVTNAVAGMAADFKLGDDLQASVNTTATLGTILRTESPNPAEYGRIPSSVVAGAPQGLLVGQTGGSDLNFAKGHAVSTVLKAMVDVDVHSKGLGVFLRADGWNDFALGHDDAAYGNYPNGFKPGAPLSDRGFSPDAKFSNAIVRDVYAYGKFDGDNQLATEARVGRQVINWGVSQFFGGGVGAATNPADFAAQFRPGALPQEAKVPVGMVSLNVMSGKEWGLDGYVPFEFRRAELPGCGTFFDVASIVQPGCDMASAVAAPIAGTPLSTIGNLTEQSLLSSGYYVHRDPDALARRGGQFGLSARYSFAAWGTELRAYAATSHNTLPNIYSVTIEDVNGATLPPGLAGGLGRLTNPNGLKYSVIFPEGTHMFGLSFDTKFDPTARVFGELAYRPNQPLGMNPNDMLNATLLRAPTALLQVQKSVLAVPPGGTFDGYDRFGVVTGSLGTNKAFIKALGADRIVVAAEVGFSHVDDLPDPTVMRYGRGFAFGSAPYLLNGTLTPCSESSPGLNGVPGRTCTGDGFVSSESWGVRGRAAATYGNVLFGAALTPSLTLAKDIRGYSYDGTFSQGRATERAGLRADWGKSYFGEVAYTHFGGGKYNLMADRSNVSLVAGIAF